MATEEPQSPIGNYVELITGLRRFTQEKAGALAHDLLAQAGLDEFATDAQHRITRLADEIVVASKANREMLQHLVRGEVDKAMGRLRFARAEEVSDLRAEVDELQARLDQLEAEQNGSGWAEAEHAPPQAGPDPLIEDVPAPAMRRPVRKVPASKTPTPKVPASKTPAKRVPAAKSAVRRASTTKATTAAKTPATQTTAKRSTTKAAKRVPTKKATVKKATVKKAPTGARL